MHNQTVIFFLVWQQMKSHTHYLFSAENSLVTKIKTAHPILTKQNFNQSNI